MCVCVGVSAKVLVVRGSPVHYLLVRANKYTGRVGLVNNVDDAVKRLQSAAGSRHGDADDDDDDDDVVLLTDAAVADHIAHHVCSCSTRTPSCPAHTLWNSSDYPEVNCLLPYFTVLHSPSMVEDYYIFTRVIMVALWNRADHCIFALWFLFLLSSLWPPCVADADIIFLPCGLFFLLSFFLSSPNLSRRRLDIYHASTHGVALVRI